MRSTERNRSGGDVGPPAIRWLDPERTDVREDSHGRLELDYAGVAYRPVQAHKAFALTGPDHYVAFRDAQDVEIGILKDPAELNASAERVLREHLEREYFIPKIRQVHGIREFWMDQIWSVETDRGAREFTIQGRDSIRFTAATAMLLIDTDENRYIIEDREALDARSRAWIDRYVW